MDIGIDRPASPAESNLEAYKIEVGSLEKKLAKQGIPPSKQVFRRTRLEDIINRLMPNTERQVNPYSG